MSTAHIIDLEAGGSSPVQDHWIGTNRNRGPALDKVASLQMTSAKPRSVRRKYQTPTHRKMLVTTTESTTLVGSRAVRPRRIDQRKASMIPVIGFRKSNRRHFAGTLLVSIAMGETKRPNCTMKGTM